MVQECLHLVLVCCNCTGQSTCRLVKCACALSVSVATVTVEPSSMILLFRCTSAHHMRHLAPSRRQQNALLPTLVEVEEAVECHMKHMNE